MYKEHPVFSKPENHDIKIWRFMDFTKFVSMLEKKALFFANSTKMGDPFEGSVSIPSIEKMKKHPFFANVSKSFFENLSNSRQQMKKFTFLNCWHMNDQESAAMWKLYLSNSEGIAIQTTFKNLTSCFEDVTSNVYIGIVNYIDYDRAVIPDDNIFWPYVHKRKSFEHERELRAVIQQIPAKSSLSWAKEPIIPGITIPIDLEKLIEKIYISPTAPSWFKDVVRSTCDKFELNIEIQDSRLNERPVY